MNLDNHSCGSTCGSFFHRSYNTTTIVKETLPLPPESGSSNAKVLSASLVDRISKAIYRRGFTAASSQGTVSTVTKAEARRSGVVKKTGEEATTEKVSWMPDPVTGCYKLENCSKEIDAAELHAIVLKKNIKQYEIPD